MTARTFASRVYPGLPPHGAGQRIGLFGGSFNPAHLGHRQVSLLAWTRLGLDRVWWVVSPGNPLKDVSALPPLAARMANAALVAAHPAIFITGVEAELSTRYTADLLKALKQRARRAHFVWIMGSDNLAQFHRWDRWRDIAEAVPIAVINRPGHLPAPLFARAAQALRDHRVDEQDAATLPDRAAPAWTFLNGPRTAASSTALREKSPS